MCMLYLTTKTRYLYLFKRLSYLSLNRKFSGFSIPLHIRNRKWKWRWWNFLSGLLCLITRWMEHIMHQTGRSAQLKTLAWFTNVMDTHTNTYSKSETTVAMHRFIHEWICVKTEKSGSPVEPIELGTAEREADSLNTSKCQTGTETNWDGIQLLG
jgi:hypothetical protein